jgi:hypothetical protein
MHIQSALRGVEEADRCSNWRMGSKSPCGVKSKSSDGVEGTKNGGFFRGGVFSGCLK